MSHAAPQLARPSSEPSLPQHIALIMDGNGRWATKHGVSRARGHNQGCETLRNLLDNCRARPFIRHLTLYAFSHENWKRSPDEVHDLMTLMRHYVKREAPTCMKTMCGCALLASLIFLHPIFATILRVSRTLHGITPPSPSPWPFHTAAVRKSWAPPAKLPQKLLQANYNLNISQHNYLPTTCTQQASLTPTC